MARVPKPVALSLTAMERDTLQAFVRRRSIHQDVVMPDRIVLACTRRTAIPNRLCGPTSPTRSSPASSVSANAL
jgi:hypothetical protein